MSEGKYTAGVLAGIRNGAAGGLGLFPWPGEIRGLGRRALVTHARCMDCPAGIHLAVSSTFIAYGGRPMCLPCVRRRAVAEEGLLGAGGNAAVPSPGATAGFSSSAPPLEPRA